MYLPQYLLCPIFGREKEPLKTFSVSHDLVVGHNWKCHALREKHLSFRGGDATKG